MPKYLKLTCILQGILALVCGVSLLLAPGRFLGLFGWAPVEPLLNRLLGAALLGLAWLCWRGFSTDDQDQARLVSEFAAVLNVLGAIGFLRHLIVARYALMVWGVFAILLIFGITWGVFRWRLQ